MPRRCKNDFSGDLPIWPAIGIPTIGSLAIVRASLGLMLVFALIGEALGNNPEKSSVEPFAVYEARRWAKEREEIEATLRYTQGTLNLANGLVTLELPPGFRFLDAKQAEDLLHKISFRRFGMSKVPTHTDNAEWLLGFRCNAGMICRSDVSPLSERSCNVIVHYDDRGHMSDDQAGQIDLREVLRDRQERGRSWFTFVVTGKPLHVIDWAKVPHYDVANRRLCWADETSVSNSGEHELWYHACLLGRTGALEMTAIAPMSRLTDTEAAVEQIMAGAKFNPRWRYEDYAPRDDKSAGSMEVILLGAKSWQEKWDSWITVLVQFILYGVVAVWLNRFFAKRYAGKWWTKPIFATVFGREPNERLTPPRSPRVKKAKREKKRPT